MVAKLVTSLVTVTVGTVAMVAKNMINAIIIDSISNSLALPDPL